MNNYSNFWYGKKCMITGGMGFGGSHLAEQLLARGAAVYIMDRLFPQNSYLVLSGLTDKVQFINSDIRNTDFLKLLLERYGIHYLFHLAAQPDVPISNHMPFETLSINVMGTYSVLEAVRCVTSPLVLIFASSGAYYGTTMQTEPIKEDQAPNTAPNMYVPSKIAGDFAVRCYVRTYGIKAGLCRFINTYGPGNTNFSTIVPRAITLLMEDQAYDFGNRDDGSSVFDYLNIDDMTRGYLAVAENIERVNGQAFNFGGGEGISVRDLVKMISRIYDSVEREPVFHGPKREVSICKLLDYSRATEILGWRPAVNLEYGLTQTIAWYKKYWPKLTMKGEAENYVKLTTAF